MSQGTVLIQTDRCKGCALCVGVCPQHVLRLGEGYNVRGYHTVQLDEGAGSCTGCALCAVVCPDVVFTVLRGAVTRPGPRPAPLPPPPAIQPVPVQRTARAAAETNGTSRRHSHNGSNGHNGHNGHNGSNSKSNQDQQSRPTTAPATLHA